ncbi:zinc-binding dehydrogenase [Chloroflexota bacterium]
MKAAVYRTGKGMVVEDIPYPTVEPDGVIVKVKASGICGSDLHGYKRGRGRDGATMGHEFSGDIEEVGANITRVKKGDRVAAMSGRTCGECYWCQQGEWIRCSKLSLLGYGMPGAFAEYVSLPLFKLGLWASKLPDTITYEEGATAEPLAVALYAVSQTQPQPGDTAVVIGLGIIGICIIPILKSLGVSQIIACGRRETRLKLARENGASVVVDAAKEDIMPIAKDVTGSKGVDIVYDCAGTPETFQQSIQMVHRGGKVDLVGLYQEPVTWNPSSIVGNDISIIGCGLKWDIPGAVELIKSGKVNTKPMITHEFPLDRISEAFETQIHAPDAIKVLVKP